MSILFIEFLELKRSSFSRALADSFCVRARLADVKILNPLSSANSCQNVNPVHSKRTNRRGKQQNTQQQQPPQYHPAETQKSCEAHKTSTKGDHKGIAIN